MFEPPELILSYVLASGARFFTYFGASGAHVGAIFEPPELMLSYVLASGAHLGAIFEPPELMFQLF